MLYVYAGPNMYFFYLKRHLRGLHIPWRWKGSIFLHVLYFSVLVARSMPALDRERQMTSVIISTSSHVKTFQRMQFRLAMNSFSYRATLSRKVKASDSLNCSSASSGSMDSENACSNYDDMEMDNSNDSSSNLNLWRFAVMDSSSNE